MNRTRVVVALALAIASVLLLAACDESGSSEDPQRVLTETFNNPTPITSGNFDLDVKIETSGGESPGRVEVKLGGRFQRRTPQQFPEFDFDVSLRAERGSQTFSGSGGLTATREGAFVNIQGTEYAVPQQLYDRFIAAYSRLQNQNGTSPGLLQSLGINPTDWLTDPRNEGIEDVEGQRTIHVSGTANVPRIVEDLKKIAKDAGSSVGKVDLRRLDQLDETIQSGDVDVNSGETDNLLRRLQLSLDLEPPAGTPGAPESLTIDFQLNLADVNKPKNIRAPASAQPLSASVLRGLGIDPNLLGMGFGSGLGSGPLPELGGSTAAPSESATEAYRQCLAQAAGVEALQRCAELLTK